MNKKDGDPNWEPDWVNPANDRRTPYTDEEIELFVDGFTRGLSEREWAAMKSELGEKKTREKIRAGFVKMDEKSLRNITPEGPVH